MSITTWTQAPAIADDLLAQGLTETEVELEVQRIVPELAFVAGGGAR